MSGGFNFGGTGGGGFSFGAKSTQSGFSFGTQATPATTAAGGALTFGTPSTQTGTSTQGLNLAGFGGASTQAAGKPAVSFGTPSTQAVGTPGFTGFATPATPASIAPGTAPAQTAQATGTAGFGFGTLGGQTTSAGAGFSLSTAAPQPSTQPTATSAAFGLTAAPQQAATGVTALGSLLAAKTTASTATTQAATSGFSFGGLKASTTAASASPGFNLAGTTTQASTTGGLGLALGGVTKTTAATTTTTAAPSLGGTLKLGGFGATVATTTSSSGLSLAGKPLAQASTATATTAATLSTDTTTTSSAATAPSMNYRQLEEEINKWSVELEEQEKIFIQQATQVNAWDRLLIENGDKISQLNTEVERVKLDQQRLDGELDFINAQQRELEEMLVPLEQTVEQMPPITFQQHADLEREHTYKLSENIDAQLKRMVQDLKEIIDHMNTSNTKTDANDPVQQIQKILNAHMHSLQWIDSNTALLQRRVEDISKLADHRKKEQERNFRVAYNP